MPLGSFPFNHWLVSLPNQLQQPQFLQLFLIQVSLQQHTVPRVSQHDCLNPEYPNGTIPDYQDFQIFGDIEETAINNEGINVGASTPAYEDANSTKKRLPRNSTLVPQLHSLEEKAIWKLLVILDSSYGVSRLCI